MSEQNIGTVVQITGPVLDIKFAADALPKLLNAITIDNHGQIITVEVAQHIGQDTVRCIAMELHRRLGARHEGRRHRHARSRCRSATRHLGRIFNLLGQPVDNKPGASRREERWPIHRPGAVLRGAAVLDRDPRDRHQGRRPDLRRIAKGGKIGLFGGAGVGKTVLIHGADQQHRQAARRLFRSSPASASVPVRATTCTTRCRSPAFSNKTALVYGQMNEPPGARMRVALSGLTMAEYFRDVERQDVLLFIDNIFRFTQAGSEVSALLGRMPSAVGYQPTLATEMGALQERITSTKKGSITSVQAVYVPADDLTDPAPATTFCASGRNDRSRPRASHRMGIYPAVDPLDSTSRILSPDVVGKEHYEVARAVQSHPAEATRSCRISSPSSAWMSCPRRTS